jgi:RNA polymerase sigma factor (sigma-70 family)
MLAETMVPEAEDGERRRERALVLSARAGDLSAYEQIVRSHQATARRVAAAIGGSSDADDIAQVAFVKAYRALHRFDAGRPFQPWLLQIVANEARSSRRLERRHRAIAERVEAQRQPAAPRRPEAHVTGGELRAKLLQALESLSDKYREVVACRFLLELSEQETCNVLGIRAGTAKSRLSRALDALRASLEQELGEEPYLRRSA